MTIEEKAKEYCPDDAYPFGPDIINKEVRKAFIAGYETAEKDLALTWEDIRKIVTLFSEVSYECFDYMSANEFCEETLRRYKEASHDRNP